MNMRRVTVGGLDGILVLGIHLVEDGPSRVLIAVSKTILLYYCEALTTSTRRFSPDSGCCGNFSRSLPKPATIKVSGAIR